MAKPELTKVEKEKEYDEYRVKDAAETIMRAHEHMADPVMMKHVGSHIAKKKHAIDSIHKKVKPKTTNDLRRMKKEMDEEAKEKEMC